MGDVTVVGVNVEHRDGLGIGVARPRLSWRTETTTPSWTQSSFEVEVHERGKRFWSSGVVVSADSVLVPWGAPPLVSRQRVTVRVRVTGVDGVASEWSAPSDVEVGLLDPADWRASFITPDWDEDTTAPQPCPHLRREFTVGPGLQRARLYVSAMGLYEVELNSSRVGDHVLAPGWSSYHHRLRYETFDITDRLVVGANAIGAMLADGWYRGVVGFAGGRRNVYGDRLALLAQVELTYDDGSTEVVVTDGTWRAQTGPLLTAELYNGESYDARLALDGWSSPGFDDSGWHAVRALDAPIGSLVARNGPPVRRTEELRPLAVTVSPSGRTLLDFGQNLVGRLRVRVSGPAGATITLRHAEVLEDGELCTAPLRNAAATDRYVLAGGDEEVWEPRFTVHGFRFAEIDGWPGEIVPGDVVAVVCHSDMVRTGWFECSDERVNRLHDNIVWSMRGNFVDVPTDCPQRDERLGWTGDIAMFVPTACFLYDCAGFLSSWLQDLAADQGEDGAVPPVVPSVFAAPPTAAWGDAAVLVPWTIYQRCGDLGVLEAQYPSMRAWVEHVLGLAGETRLWDRGFQFGDWLDPSAPADRPHHGRTDAHLVATAFLAHSTELLASTAELLGNGDDAARYRQLAGEVRDAFAREYLSPSGRTVSDSQTAYALALQFDLITDPDQRARAGRRLAQLVRHAGHRIATGFVGTPVISDALTETGHADTAFALLGQEECPSWLYPVLHGATTIWERWDGILPDGRVNPDQMNSFNHYALGAVGDWLQRTVGGLRPGGAGYRHIVIQPVPGGELTHAQSRHLTPYGLAESAWRTDGTTLEVTAVIPPNTTATVVLPGVSVEHVGSGTHEWKCELQERLG